MIIREYEYEKDRPWNCQERFIDMKGYDNPWQEYKDKLFSETSNILSFGDKKSILGRVMHEDLEDKALYVEFKLLDRIYVHVAQEWTKQFSREPIVKKIGKGED